MTVSQEGSDPSKEKTPPLALSIVLHEMLYLLRAAQGLTRQKGAQLEGKSFSHYRKVLSRKIARSRDKLKLKMRLKGKKDFVVPEFDHCESVEHVLLEVYIIERAWARAMEAKQYSADDYDDGDYDDESKDGSNMNKHQPPRRCRMRLRKAARVAATLEHAAVKTDATQKLRCELDAFANTLRGLDLEAHCYEKLAMKAFAKSAAIYGELSQVGTAWQQDVFGTLYAEAKASKQRCRYRMKVRGDFIDDDGDGNTVEDADGEVALTDSSFFAQTSNAGADTVVAWCGRNILVPSAKLRSKFEEGLALLASEERLDDDTSTAKRLEMLEECVKTISCEEKALTAEGAFAVGEKVEAQKEGLTWLKARAEYEKLALVSRRLERAVDDRKKQWCTSLRWRAAFAVRGFVETASEEKEADEEEHAHPNIADADDIARLYESLSRILADIAALPGVQSAPDDTLAENLECEKAAVKAYRCYFLAEAYVDSDDSKRAPALFTHAIYLSERAKLEAEASVNCEHTVNIIFALCKDAEVAALRINALDELRERRVLLQLNSSSVKTTICREQHHSVMMRNRVIINSIAREKNVFEKITADNIFDLHLINYDSTMPQNRLRGSDGAYCSHVAGAHLPPRRKSLSSKPLLFDIAINHVLFAVSNLETRSCAIAQSNQSHRNLFTWFRGAAAR